MGGRTEDGWRFQIAKENGDILFDEPSFQDIFEVVGALNGGMWDGGRRGRVKRWKR